jgi:hypothetical protein
MHQKEQNRQKEGKGKDQENKFSNFFLLPFSFHVFKFNKIIQ